MKNHIWSSKRFEDRLYVIFWKITGKCNYKCPYCIVKDSPEYINDFNEKEIINIITPRVKKIIESINTKVCLDFSGGEATLVDLIKIIDQLSDAKNLDHFSLTTNGWRPLSWFEDLFKTVIKNNKYITIITSIHETEVNDLNELLTKFLNIQMMAKKYNCTSIASFVRSDNKPSEDILDKFIEKHPDFKYWKVNDYNK